MTVSNLVSNLNWTEMMQAESVQKKPISGYLSAEWTAGSTLNTLIFAAIHGDEPESVTLIEAWAKQWPLENTDCPLVGIIPVLNPDGFAAKTRVNANGVDLNRNFPTANWGEPHDESKYHGGPSPASEPETQFLIETLNTYSPQKIISIHTPYRVINYDGNALELAEEMAKHTGYPVVSDIGYPTPGSFGNYCAHVKQIPLITLELPEGEAFTEVELANNIAALNHAVLFNG